MTKLGALRYTLFINIYLLICSASCPWGIDTSCIVTYILHKARFHKLLSVIAIYGNIYKYSHVS